MTRRTWVYTEGGRPLPEPYESTGEEQPVVRVEIAAGALYDGQRALDGTDVSSRSKFNEYLRRTGCTVASDFTQHWADAAKKREAYFSGKARNPQLREAIGRAAYQLEMKRGKRK